MIKKTLYFGNPAYLSLKERQLVIRLPEVEKADLPQDFKKQAIRTIPIEDIGVVVLDNKQITITTGLMDALLENTCAVITCNSKGLPTGLMLPLYGNTTQNERFRNQIDASLPLKKQLWQQTVQQKIYNQAMAMKQCSNAEIGCMMAWSNDVKSGDTGNQEAIAAAYYWRNFFPQFSNFVRDKDGEYPNCLLNYGYAILRAIIARALVGTGLLPTLGIHHHNRYNAYCLADDIMEPYRPFVDRFVFGLINSYPEKKDLDKELKSQLLGIPVLDVSINGKRSPLMVAAGTTTASLYKCFAGIQRKVLYPELD